MCIYTHIYVYTDTLLHITCMYIAPVTYCFMKKSPKTTTIYYHAHICAAGMWIDWNSPAPHVSHPP